jgi:hypothetical protein
MGAKTAAMSGQAPIDRVAVWEGADALYVAALPRGPITVLQGTAVTIWRAANAGSLEGAAERVAHTLGLQADEIRTSVDEFVARLISQGLISPPR